MKIFLYKAKQKCIEYLKMFQIYIEAMIHRFFNYFTKIRKNRHCPLTVFVKSRVSLKDIGVILANFDLSGKLPLVKEALTINMLTA